MIPIRPILCAFALIGLAACGTDSDSLQLGALGEPQISRLNQAAPPGAEPGTCWGKTVTPAIIETVTDQVISRPAQIADDGTVTRPAAYRTETKQEIVRERTETWFRTPCPDQMTEEFVASLQRALAARGLYAWPVNSRMDARTRAAVRQYQEPQGLDSGILSLDAARKLGLIAIEIESDA